MGMKAYREGQSWEDTVLNYHKNQGYWVMKVPTDLAGTVFDIIAMKDNKVICIECKHIQGNKLYYESSGLKRKRDELDKFTSYNNGVILYIKSDKDGVFILDWVHAKAIFENKGYITRKDCVSIKL